MSVIVKCVYSAFGADGQAEVKQIIRRVMAALVTLCDGCGSFSVETAHDEITGKLTLYTVVYEAGCKAPGFQEAVASLLRVSLEHRGFGLIEVFSPDAKEEYNVRT